MEWATDVFKVFSWWSERRKRKSKLAVWNALERTGPAAHWPTIEALAKETGIDADELKPLIYEMIQDGTVFEAPIPGTFTRYKGQGAAHV